jgi:UDP-N-acetylglucosamine 2-epimerase (non-hydrolysing)
MKRTTAHLVAAARPNFMKVAPLFHELSSSSWCVPRLIHTGQHYDFNMSAAFFRDLGLPDPDHHLEVGSGPHGDQTGRILMRYEALLLGHRPDVVVVVGDVNSTVACALAATKLLIPVAHLEAGLRSGDRTMPEEINRLITDTISDVLWTPSRDADANLEREGVPRSKISMVGNIMMDSYERLRPLIEELAPWDELGLTESGYGVVTLHRPSNVDDPEVLRTILEALTDAAKRLPLVFPVHPRTAKQLSSFGLMEELRVQPGIHLTEPMSYIPFMSLVRGAQLIVTDSGGVQEETTYLGIRCLTLRPNTERPITITHGTNRLIDPEHLSTAIATSLREPLPNHEAPELWDGRTAGRVAEDLRRRLGA